MCASDLPISSAIFASMLALIYLAGGHRTLCVGGPEKAADVAKVIDAAGFVVMGLAGLHDW
jgi:hypothetical protein